MRPLLRRQARWPRRRRSLWLLLLSAFGLGSAVGYAAGAQRSVLGLAFLAGLLIGLLAVERFWAGRRAARAAEQPAAPVEREQPSRPPENAYDLARDRSTRRQRYLM